MCKKVAISILLSLSLLSGCFGMAPEEELYRIFEDATRQEASMLKHAKILTELEQQNIQLYSRILNEGQSSNESVQPLIEQAIQEISKREQALNEERAIMQHVSEKIKEAREPIKQIDDKKLHKQAQGVAVLYEQRVQRFMNMYDSYKQALTQEQKLYDMLRSDTEQIKSISDQVKEVNRLYADKQTHNQDFNELTRQYNESKIKFYREAGFQVEKINHNKSKPS